MAPWVSKSSLSFTQSLTPMPICSFALGHTICNSNACIDRQIFHMVGFVASVPKIASAVNERKLVPDEVILALLSKRLEEGYYRGENGFILDGIPRTRTQAEIVDQIADLDSVVNLECANRSKSSKMGRNPFLLIDFQVKAAPGETWHGLLAALHLQHINAANSSQKLTT